MCWKTYLSDVLISDSTYLLDIGCTLRNILQRVSGKNQFVFLVFRYLHINAWMHYNPSYNLLANEVPDQPLCESFFSLSVLRLWLVERLWISRTVFRPRISPFLSYSQYWRWWGNAHTRIAFCIWNPGWHQWSSCWWGFSRSEEWPRFCVHHDAARCWRLSLKGGKSRPKDGIDFSQVCLKQRQSAPRPWA